MSWDVLLISAKGQRTPALQGRLMGQWEIKKQLLFDAIVSGPLLSLTVTLCHCFLVGLTRWAEGCDMLWKGNTAF